MRKPTVITISALGLCTLLGGLPACASEPTSEPTSAPNDARASSDGGLARDVDAEGADAAPLEAATPVVEPVPSTRAAPLSPTSESVRFFDAPDATGAERGAAAAGVTPCGPGVYCVAPTTPNKHACIIASRLRYEDYAEDYIVGCRSTHDFVATSWSPLPVEVFDVHMNDMESPMVAVVSRPEGGAWVLPLFNLEVSVAGDETIEHLSVRAYEEAGHLRVEAEMRSKGAYYSCTEESPHWADERADAIYCGDAGGGEVACTGRIPLSVIALEVHTDDDGYEINRRRLSYYGFRPEWSGTNVHFARRFGRLSRGHRALLGTHSITDAWAILRSARRGS